MHFANHQLGFDRRVGINPRFRFFRRSSAQDEEPDYVGIAAEWSRRYCFSGLQQGNDVPQVLMKNLISLRLSSRVPFGTFLHDRHLKLHHLVLLRKNKSGSEENNKSDKDYPEFHKSLLRSSGIARNLAHRAELKV